MKMLILTAAHTCCKLAVAILICGNCAAFTLLGRSTVRLAAAIGALQERPKAFVPPADVRATA